jgi:metallo-beta-lactamase family protein
MKAILTMRFLGAAGTVTGSKFLVSANGSRLLVDCGLFQGLKELRLRNWDEFPVDAASIETILLTHTHLDHSGYIPRICASGFKGRVIATASTMELCRIVLPDSGHLQEEEAGYANAKHYSKHSPALPLYTEEDAWEALQRFSSAPFHSSGECAGFRYSFRHAGHILGAASVLIENIDDGGQRVLFSGDLGRPSHPILRAPEPPPDADVIVVESTYGDRRHDDADATNLFAEAINGTYRRGGTVIIPSFAVDRTEIILFHLRRLKEDRRIPAMPIYVDSPMALAALRVYKKAIESGVPEVRDDIAGNPSVLDPGDLIEIKTPDESRALNREPGPMIIIAASGMGTGGRVLHHLAHRLSDERNSVILVGYQAAGTRGRLLLEHAPAIKMLGRYVPVRANVIDIPAFSVHADQGEIISWLASASSKPELIYVVHGDPEAAAALRTAISRELSIDAVVPRHLEQVRLD